MDKTIRRVTSLEEQEDENFRYWQSVPVGDRIVAVCELSQAAYAFAASFKGEPLDADKGSEGPAPSFERKRG